MPSPLPSALTAARAAGQILKNKFLQPREIKSKGWRDIVTDADFAAQTAVFEILTRDFPQAVILSEESRHDIDLSAPGPTWILDPLDGTTNYSRQLPAFCVSLGLAHKNELVVGVIYDPLVGEMFYAEKGAGAFVENDGGQPRPLRVSVLADITEAVVGLDGSRDPAIRSRALGAVPRAGETVRSLRSFGAAALGLAYLAAGRLDGYYHLSLQPWDVAAGAVLIAEAGGQISAPDGSAWQLGNPELVTSNGVLHADLVRILRLV